MLSEKRTEQIKQEAHAILEKFGTLLGSSSIESSAFANGDGMRADMALAQDPFFRDRLFENAPETKGDCIVAEKASW